MHKGYKDMGIARPSMALSISHLEGYWCVVGRATRSIATVSLIGSLAACGGGKDETTTEKVPVSQEARCQTPFVTAAFASDTNTKVVQVKAFNVGDPLLLTGQATQTTPAATQKMCVVELLVGPARVGPDSAPSTSKGIGIRIWLPSPDKWNKRIHVLGEGGWMGSLVGSGTGVHPLQDNWSIAQDEGAVTASTDAANNAPTTGGSFLMNPDGSINTGGWTDLVQRGVHEMAVKTKLMTQSYYDTAARYAYYEGGSTGGREGLKSAQAYPTDYNGIVAAYPSVNWSKFITAGLYPQIVFQRDLGGIALTHAQADLVSNAAISACDVVGGKHLGFVLDPSQCRYDATKDTGVLCVSSGGTNASSACVTTVQAQAANKIWYGMTSDGSAPDPAVDNGWGVQLSGNHRWYGLARGTSFWGQWWVNVFKIPSSYPVAYASSDGPFSVSTHQIALQLQNPKIADPSFTNAQANGQDGWKALSYADLSHAFDLGVALQPQFSNVNSDDPDLSAFRNAGGKLLTIHGFNDELVFPQGTINYYERVASTMGGMSQAQGFYKLYMVPGMGHASVQGTSNPDANPPIPSNFKAYELLTAWIESGAEPGRVDISSPTSSPQSSSLPMCVYPTKAVYRSGDPFASTSYVCG